MPHPIRPLIRRAAIVAAFATCLTGSAAFATPTHDVNRPAPTAASPVQPPLPSSVSLAASAVRIRRGHPVRFTLHLATAPVTVPHQQVQLLTRTRHDWRVYATIRTDSHGNAAFTLRPHTTAQWRARYPGTPLWQPAVSAIRTITVTSLPTLAQKVLAEAAHLRGAPYVYGAAGPHAFDCSGFTMYVFGRFGVTLPHNAAAQYDRVHRESVADLRPGDLVFFTGSSGIYHVGIYAGNGQMWDAPHSGDHVRRENINSSNILAGRVH